MRWDLSACGEAVVTKYRRERGENNPLTTEEDGGRWEELQSGNNGRKTHCRRAKRQHRTPLREEVGGKGDIKQRYNINVNVTYANRCSSFLLSTADFS